jgi:ferritin
MPELDADLLSGARNMIAAHVKTEQYYHACDQWARLKGWGGGGVKGLQDWYEEQAKWQQHLWRKWAKLLIEDYEQEQGVPAAPEASVTYPDLSGAIKNNLKTERALMQDLESVLATARSADNGGGVFERFVLKRIGETRKKIRTYLEFQEQLGLAGDDRAALLQVNKYIGKQVGH